MGTDYALIVGVNCCPNFRLADGSKPRPLRGAENDADAIAALVVEQLGYASENVTILKGKAATYTELKAHFVRLQKTLTSNDHLLFHFSGHGTQVADVKPFDEYDRDRLDEALCLYDATAEGKNVLLDDTLGLWLEDLPAARITILLDCCHAGTAIKDPDESIQSRWLPIARTTGKGEARPWSDLSGVAKSFRPQITALYACHSEQQAYERLFITRKSAQRMGQFTHFLVEAVISRSADTDRNNEFTVSELTTYIAKRLDETYNRNRPREDQQRPSSDVSGDNVTLFSNSQQP
ncbi:MAG: caspase family protein [Pirellulales bacterium]|nr:caspase family protein [Pirellulales bacterium]